jgi:hypothetical protein
MIFRVYKHLRVNYKAISSQLSGLSLFKDGLVVAL